MPNIKLVYFKFRGRAEFIRLVLQAAGQEYEEETVQVDDWPKVKPTTPYGTLPYMVYNGKVYGQSGAIGVFLAREFGFYGKTHLDALRIDEVHGLWEDQAETMVKSRWAQDEKEKAEFTRKVLEEDFPKYFGLYEKLLKENGGSGYLVGDSVSLGDFYLYDMQENFRHLKKDHLKDYPLMQKLCKIVESHPRIKAYLASRKESIM